MKPELSDENLSGVKQSPPVVLLVDDEPNVLYSLARALRHEPYLIYTARSAEEAMAILKAHNIDLIVSDENMSGISGTEFLSWVAKHFPDKKRIILTGQSDLPSTVRDSSESPIYRFFTKPCDVAELAQTIRSGLEEKESLR